MVEETVHCPTRKAWRAWLKKNHLKEKTVNLLVWKKHTGKPSISHREAMEDAICYGWIDTTLKRLDENRYIRRFARRSDNSRWSNATLGYAKRLIGEEMMSPEGLRRYEEGLKKPVIDHGLGKNPPVQSDLKIALEKNPKARDLFNSLAPSYRRTYIIWLERAKRPETREKRIKAIIARALRGEKHGTLKQDN